MAAIDGAFVTTSVAASMRQNIGHEEEGQAKDEIDRQQLNTFQPVRSSVVRDLPGNQHRQPVRQLLNVRIANQTFSSHGTLPESRIADGFAVRRFGNRGC